MRANRFAIAVVTLAFFGLLAGPAAAEISGPCSASIAGVSVRDRTTNARSEAIKVAQNSFVPVSMRSARQITHLQVQLEFAGIAWSVHDEPTTGTSWSKTVNVDKYAKYGVGLYKVSGSSSGPNLSCTGAALVQVDGNPLQTVAGWVGLALAAAGILGIVALAFGGSGPGALVLGAIAGVVAALGVTALLQQFAVLYPTQLVALVMLAIGLAVGIAVPATGGALKHRS
jgi:hypothetical protein